MNRYLLLILLSSWAHVVPLSLQCETGVAYPNHVLSVPRSLMANADVAILKTYKAETLDKCITDCCAEKFGSCSVASFRKTNETEENCQLYNCRPIQKCKFLSSNSTDSFSFSSSSPNPVLVPSSHASKNDTLSTIATVTTSQPKLDKFSLNSQEHAVSQESIINNSEEQFALKNDNTTIKPRKGVDEVTESSFENVSRSGVKPRKGVSLDGLISSNNSKSKVKPRKGVGPFQSHSVLPSNNVESSVLKISPTKSIVLSATSSVRTYKDKVSDDIVSALEKVFEEDNLKINHKSSTVSVVSSSTTEISSKTSATSANAFTSVTSVSMYTSTSTDKPSSTLQPSVAVSYIASSTAQTPDLVTPTVQTTEIFGQYFQPSSSRPSIFEHSKLLFHASDSANDVKTVQHEDTDSEESESERKYKSSMHLVLSLVFGLLVLFSVLGVIAKRIYDGWLRRHYRRMDFLIDGMYNGYG